MLNDEFGAYDLIRQSFNMLNLTYKVTPQVRQEKCVIIDPILIFGESVGLLETARANKKAYEGQAAARVELNQLEKDAAKI